MDVSQIGNQLAGDRSVSALTEISVLEGTPDGVLIRVEPMISNLALRPSDTHPSGTIHRQLEILDANPSAFARPEAADPHQEYVSGDTRAPRSDVRAGGREPPHAGR
jgi:hypothetical protein